MAKTDKNKIKKRYGSGDSIDDEQALNILNEEVSYYMARNKAGNSLDRTQWLYEGDDGLTVEEQKKINNAIKEADRGNTVSDEGFRKAMARWLTK